jgi:hypothetical protein
MPDSEGNAYALVSEVKAGDWLRIGRGFTTLAEDEVVQVYETQGSSPRLAVSSTLGDHDLVGQLNPDGTYHGGLSPDGTEYTGLYPAEAPEEADETTTEPPKESKREF